MPTPPLTTKAPVVDDTEFVVLVNLTNPLAVKSVKVNELLN